MEYRTVLNDGRVITHKDQLKQGVFTLCPLCNAKISRSFGSIDNMVNFKGDHGIVESFGDICQKCGIKYEAVYEQRMEKRSGGFTEWRKFY